MVPALNLQSLILHMAVRAAAVADTAAAATTQERHEGAYAVDIGVERRADCAYCVKEY